MASSVSPDPSTVRYDDGPWLHRDVSANGIRFHVAEAGTGPLVLLLHGFGQFWWSWRHQLAGLAEAGFRAVAPDLRGYGDTDKPPTGYDAFVLADDVAALVRGLGEREAVIVGTGFGGLAAYNTAVLHPEQVSAVVAVASAHPVTLTKIRKSLYTGGYQNLLSWAQWPFWPERRLVASGGAELERIFRRDAGRDWSSSADFTEVMVRMRKAICIPGAAPSALEHLRWVARSPWQADGVRHREVLTAQPVTVPVLNLGADADPVIPVDMLAEAGEHCVGDYRQRILTGSGHYPAEEQPDAVTEAIVDFAREAATAR